MSGTPHDVSQETKPSELLRPETLRRLERIAFRPGRPFAGRERGERRSPRRGAGSEFAGHRSYVPGDDPRLLDWSVLARLDRLCVKTFHEEDDLAVHVLLDASASMAFGEPPKWLAARAVAGAAAHVALAGLDRVSLAAFSSEGAAILPPGRGRGRLFEVLRFLDGLPAAGGSDLTGPFRRFAREARPGVSVVLSDLLCPGWEDWLRPLFAHGHRIAVIRVLAPAELEPREDGDLELVDSETGATMPVTLSPRTRRAYAARLAADGEKARRFCCSNGADFVCISSGTPPDRLLAEALGGLRLVRS